MLPNITIKEIVENLKFLENKRIKKIQEIKNNVFKMRIGREQIIFSDSFIFLTKKTIPAKQTSSGFGAYLNKHLAGKEIKKIYQPNLERIIIFEIGGEKTEKLIIEFLNPGNIILVDEKNQIKSAYKKQSFGSRTLKKGEKYIFPPLKKSPLEIKIDTNKSLLKQIIKQYNIYPLILEKAAETCQCTIKEKPDKKQAECLERYIKAAYKKKYSIFYLTVKDITPIIKNEKEIIKKGNLFDLLDNYFSPLLFNQPEKNKKEIALKKSYEQMQKKEKEFEEQIKLCKEKAEKIYSNYVLISEIIKAINKGVDKKIEKKEIEKKLKEKIPQIKEIDFKKKKIILDI